MSTNAIPGGTGFNLPIPGDAALNTHITQFAAPINNLETGLTQWCVATGSANAYVIAPAPAVVKTGATALPAGICICFQANFTNTGAATVAVNGVVTVALVRPDGTALQAGDIVSNSIVHARYDGTSFRLLSWPAVLPVPVAQGGTGAIAAPGARSNLSAAASGVNNDITSLTGLTTPLPVSEGGIGVATITGLVKGSGTSAFAAATDGTDYMSPASVQNEVASYINTDSGTATAYAIAPTPAYATLVTGAYFAFKPAHSNSGADPTLAVGSTAAKTVKKNGSVALVAGDIVTGVIAEVVYDGTNWQLLNPQVNSIAAGGTGATTAANARTNLSAAQSGANGDITSLTGLTTPLTVAQGGIGVGTLTGLVKGNGTGAFTAAVHNVDYESPADAQNHASTYAADTGVADAYVVTLSPAPAALVVGQVVFFKASNTNATTTPTLNVNSLGAVTIVKHGGQPMQAGDIVAGGIAIVVYDGTNYECKSPTITGIGGGGTGATTAAGARSNLSAAPNTPKYIVQTTAAELSNAQVLGALATGLVKNTTTTGVLSIAVSGTDYAEVGTNASITSLTGLTTPLSVPQGGSGAATITGLVKGNGASAMTAATADTDYAKVDPGLNEYRLTLLTGTPVTNADQIGIGTIYLTPFAGGRISLYSGAATWKTFAPGEKSLALSGLTSGNVYDVFAYDNSGTVTLELSAAWTNATTRANTLAYQDGVLVKSIDHSRRWVGTFAATGTATTEDSAANRLLLSAQNKVRKHLLSNDNAAWTTTSSTFAQVGTVAVSFVTDGNNCGDLTGFSPMKTGTANANGILAIGSSTSAAASGCAPGVVAASAFVTCVTVESDFLSAGYYTRYLLFKSANNTATITADGSQGNSSSVLRGTVWV